MYLCHQVTLGFTAVAPKDDVTLCKSDVKLRTERLSLVVSASLTAVETL